MSVDGSPDVQVFIYGTLLDRVLRERLLGRAVATKAATLADHIVLSQAHSPSPALVARAGDITQGQVLLDVNAADLTRLDAYECAFSYAPVPKDITVDGQITTALVYMPDTSVAISAERWTLAAWADHSGPLKREMAVEIGGYTPPLSGKALRRQWHMIALRAGVRLRALDDQTPAARRYEPAAGDREIVAQSALMGDFFKFSAFEVTHRTFQNEVAGPLPREVLVACDAAIVLPYDPRTDCVLLVEQIRMGPLVRGVPNPWMLEPVAGMVDGGETPAEAARRETQEEANLTDFDLEAMFSFYPSPGSSTDYFYCYLANGALPEPTTFTGGLAEENEDLRIHVLRFDDALALIESGEANVGPLIAMLYWLARHRDRLRSAA